MRVSFVFFASLALASSALSQDAAKQPPKGKEAMKHDMAGMAGMAGPWKEMNAFHTVLGATFHPAKDKKDLKPLREKADALAAAARAWTASTPPSSCSDAAIRSTVAAIATESLAIGNQVLASATDAELTAAITIVHDKFETVEKKCGGHDMKGMKH